MLEFRDWKRSDTERKYLLGTKVAYVPLGEEAYGLILVTPWQNIHIESIPQYGGEPKYDCWWSGTVKEAVEYIKKSCT